MIEALPSVEELVQAIDDQLRATLSAEEYAEMERLIDDEPQPTPTPQQTKAQGMDAAQARATLEAIKRGPIAKE